MHLYQLYVNEQGCSFRLSVQKSGVERTNWEFGRIHIAKLTNDNARIVMISVANSEM